MHLVGSFYVDVSRRLVNKTLKKQVVAFKCYIQNVHSFRFKPNECRRICFLEPAPLLNVLDGYKTNRGISPHVPVHKM